MNVVKRTRDLYRFIPVCSSECYYRSRFTDANPPIKAELILRANISHNAYARITHNGGVLVATRATMSILMAEISKCR